MYQSADLAALLDHLSPAEAVRLSTRLPAASRHEVLAEALPASPEVRAAIVAWAIEEGDGDDRDALIRGSAPNADVPEALAGAGDPALRVAAYLHPSATAALRRRMLAGGPDVPPVPEELRDRLLASRSRLLLGPARAAADRTIAAHAARHVRGPRRQPPPHAPEDVHAWFRASIPARPTDYRTRLRRTAVRRRNARLAAVVFEAWSRADWITLARLHAADPLDPATADHLATHPACLAAAPDVAPLLAGTLDGVVHAAVAGLRAGVLTPGGLYTRTGNAPLLLAALADPGFGVLSREIPGIREAHAALRETVRRVLGDDPTHWRSLLALLRGDFPGTIPELLRAAALLPPPEVYPPHPEHTLRSGGSPWTFLLALAESATVGSVVAALAAPADPSSPAGHSADRATAIGTPVPAFGPGDGWGEEMSRLPEGSPLPGALIAAFAAVADEPARAEFARRHGGDPEVAESLVGLDDPAVNAALILKHRPRTRTIRRILSGTAAAGGPPGAIPLHPSVFADADTPWPRVARTHRVHCNDPALIVDALRTQTAMCAGYQTAACRRLVALGRADLVRDFVTGSRGTGRAEPHTILTRTLAELPDPDDAGVVAEALRELAAELFLADLRTPNLSDLLCHFEFDAEPDWAAVRATRADGGLIRIAGILSRLDDLPADVARAVLTADPDRCATTLAPRSAALARLALDTAELPRPNGGPGAYPNSPDWPERCLREGLFAIEDLIARGRPAGAVLRICRALPATTHGADDLVADLIARHGPLSPDAWAVFAAMMGDFPGTLPELLGVAVAATA
ncbi:hypothetical protein [Embleya hyalina]|uniref:Uncharacterized protein n=1 Tax=Embleya hyalina TaxID=516124 RepID=A0A401YZU4_9ACTN|nr:hypothetical protein [Embleya hyalina]GCE00153.1 hypothetical protein EHYA_07878 [Embleya hyalina]